MSQYPLFSTFMCPSCKHQDFGNVEHDRSCARCGWRLNKYNTLVPHRKPDGNTGWAPRKDMR